MGIAIVMQAVVLSQKVFRPFQLFCYVYRESLLVFRCPVYLQVIKQLIIVELAIEIRGSTPEIVRFRFPGGKWLFLWKYMQF